MTKPLIKNPVSSDYLKSLMTTLKGSIGHPQQIFIRTPSVKQEEQYRPSTFRYIIDNCKLEISKALERIELTI